MGGFHYRHSSPRRELSLLSTANVTYQEKAKQDWYGGTVSSSLIAINKGTNSLEIRY